MRDRTPSLTRDFFVAILVAAAVPLGLVCGIVAYRYHSVPSALKIFLAGTVFVVAVAAVFSRRIGRAFSELPRQKEPHEGEGRGEGPPLGKLLERLSADEPEEMQTIEAGETAQQVNLASLSEFAGGIAHEINNPVAIMVEEAGWIEDLLEEEDFRQSENLEEFKRALHQIKTQGRRCKEITSNLLSFARQTDSKVEEVQLNRVIEEVIRAGEKKIAARNVTITTHLADELPIVYVSPSEMQQVFVNLLNNAIDAMDDAGGRVEITTRRDGNDIVVDMADSGQGIAQAHLTKIFDPFFTTKPVGRGTGLGLSICHGIVSRIGGDIRVESEPGIGTTFHVRIPTRAPADREKSPVTARKPVVGEYESRREELVKTPTVVLLVFEEPPFVETMAKRLTKRNLVVLKALSGREALRTLEAQSNIDVVIMDVKMSEMDGIEVLTEIKSAYPLVEVILLSGHATVELAIEGMKRGAFDYLLKPCDMVQLFARIDRAKMKKLEQEQNAMKARIKEITLRGRG